MLPHKLLAPSAKQAHDGGEKTAFFELFVSKIMHRFTHFPAAYFSEI